MENVDSLVARYETLIGYYREMLELTCGISKKLEAEGKLTGIASLLDKKKSIVGSIENISQDIAETKKAMSIGEAVPDCDVARIRDVESRLTVAVNDIIDENRKMYDLMMKQGVKVRGR